MSKDLLYRPDLSYEKSYYTEGDLFNVNDNTNINSNDLNDDSSNKVDNIKDLQQNIISKLPTIPQDILDVFLPPFLVIKDVLDDLIDNPPIPPQPEPEEMPEPEPIPGVMPDIIYPDPDPDYPSDPFGKEEDIYVDVEVEVIPEDVIIDIEYRKDMLDILEDYLIKYNNILDKYIANIITSLSVSKHSSLKVLTTKELKDKDLSHVTDYLTKSKITLRQQIKLYKKMFNIDETIFHIRSAKVANEQRKRYRTNKKLKDENTLAKTGNDLLRESIMVAEKKYEENFYGLYKYLNSSVILFNECTSTVIKQKQALVLINNKER